MVSIPSPMNLRHWMSLAASSCGQSTNLASFWAFSSGRLMLAHQQRALPDIETALTTQSGNFTITYVTVSLAVF